MLLEILPKSSTRTIPNQASTTASLQATSPVTPRSIMFFGPQERSPHYPTQVPLCRIWPVIKTILQTSRTPAFPRTIDQVPRTCCPRSWAEDLKRKKAGLLNQIRAKTIWTSRPRGTLTSDKINHRARPTTITLTSPNLRLYNLPNNDFLWMIAIKAWSITSITSLASPNSPPSENSENNCKSRKFRRRTVLRTKICTTHWNLQIFREEPTPQSIHLECGARWRLLRWQTVWIEPRCQ